MGKYKVYARRNPYTDWTVWCDTNDIKVAQKSKAVIESYGYQWTDEELMPRTTFKERREERLKNLNINDPSPNRQARERNYKIWEMRGKQR